MIHAEMAIEEILGMFPHKAQRLSQEISGAGLHCIGCQAATWETLRVGMLSHSKTEDQIDDLVTRLNTLLKDESNPSTITFTKRAAAKFLAFGAEEQKQGWALRFGIQASGCSGHEYILDFSEKADDDDQIFTSEGIEIHVKEKLVPKVIGSEIDYVDGLNNAGFKVSNPHVRSSCGCGQSHGY